MYSPPDGNPVQNDPSRPEPDEFPEATSNLPDAYPLFGPVEGLPSRAMMDPILTTAQSRICEPRNQATMTDPLNRTAKRKVPAESIVEGDLIYRPGQGRGDAMMVVQSVDTGIHEGIEVFVWGGDVFTFVTDTEGRGANSLGDITATDYAQAVWTVPVDQQVTKGVPPDEADRGY
jgi:hypothetical protein